MTQPPRVPAELAGRPFLLSEARRHGITATMLQGTRWRRLTRGVYVEAAIPDSRELVLSAVRLVIPPGAVVTGVTAVLLLGCDVRRRPDEPAEVTAPRGVTFRNRGGLLLPRQALIADDDVVEIGGLLVTSPLRTAFDLARRSDLAEGVVALDALWRAGLVTPDGLLAYAETKPRWRGVRQVARVAKLADARAENAMESRLRMRLVLGGLPKPEVQLSVRVDGHEIARLDLAYEHVLLDVEFDGRDHWLASEWHRRDGRRNHDLVSLGWVTLAFGSADVYRRPAYICHKVGLLLRRAA